MNRRDLLLALLAGSVAPASFAQAPLVRPVVDVVKVMSFSCSFCLTSEAQDRAIEEAAVATGGRFVRAPIPESPAAVAAREKAYYAARDLDPQFGERVKASLYKGSQDAQVPLETFAHVYYWLEQDLPNDYARMHALIERAQAPAAASALERAIRLTISAGVQTLPTYVLLTDGKLGTSVDRESAGGGSMLALRDAVISRITSR